MAFLAKLINQSEKTENMQDEVGSKINEKDRYRATVLPGQNVKYPSFIPVEFPHSYTVQRDKSDPRFQVIYPDDNAL